jgi:hypothetical protein
VKRVIERVMERGILREKKVKISLYERTYTFEL